MTASNVCIDSESEVNGVQGFEALWECGAKELHLMLHNSNKAINVRLSINQSWWDFIVIFLYLFRIRWPKYVRRKWSETNSALIFGLLY